MPTAIVPFNIGPVELVLILFLVLLILGPGRLPDVGRALGRSISELRKAQTDDGRESGDVVEDAGSQVLPREDGRHMEGIG